MPSKKKKYNARFPAGRIKKIMQTDEEVGKVAQAVPVIISRTLELFVESLLTKSTQITQARNAKTLTPSHMKQCILSESRFDFLKDLVKNIPDASIQEDNENNAIFDDSNLEFRSSELMEPTINPQNNPPTISPGMPAANFYHEQSSSSSRTPVIQYGPKITQPTPRIVTLDDDDDGDDDEDEEPQLRITVAPDEVMRSNSGSNSASAVAAATAINCSTVPPLIPISHNMYGQNTGDNLCIDEDYDN